jgi:taspase (threonine aspartase 1)
LAGDGARKWALKRGLHAAKGFTEAEQWNVTEGAKRQWQVYADMIAGTPPAWELPSDAIDSAAKRKRQIAAPGNDASDGPQKRQRQRQGPDLDSKAGAPQGTSPEDLAEGRGRCYDTVGCICINSKGECAASVSSGGVAVKSCGRVGEAAVYGSGCWAGHSGAQGGVQLATACSITGLGENIIRAGLSRMVCEVLSSSTADPMGVCRDAIQTRILDSPPPGPPVPTDCGMIVLRAEGGPQSITLDFLTAHCSASMAFAHFHHGLSGPVCRIDRTKNGHTGTPQISLSGASVPWDVRS